MDDVQGESPNRVVGRTVLKVGVRPISQKDDMLQNDEKPKYGRLTVMSTSMVKTGQQQNTVAECLCDCGAKTTKRLTRIVTGSIVSCGCLRAEKARERAALRNYRHGKARTRLYRVFCAVKSRCYNPNVPCYPRYGGRGILVCDEWLKDFTAFETWSIANGYSNLLNLHRIDKNGNYEPSNCKWTQKQGDVLVSAFGESKTIDEWLHDKRCKMKSIAALCYRINSGWPLEKAISLPPQRD